MAIIEAVDQVQIAGAATAGANGEIAGEMRVGTGREGRGLLMPRMDPFHIVAFANAFRDGVQTVADDAIDVADADRVKAVDHKISDSRFCHEHASGTASSAEPPRLKVKPQRSSLRSGPAGPERIRNGI